MNETAQLAKFTAEMEFDKLPPQAVLMAKQCLLDWLGVALRGAHEEPARILRETALKMCGTGESTVFDGAAGGVEFITCVKSIEDGYVHPTVGLENPGEGCDLDYTMHEGVSMDVNYAISNSLGFGGHNASLIVKKFTA